MFLLLLGDPGIDRALVTFKHRQAAEYAVRSFVKRPCLNKRQEEIRVNFNPRVGGDAPAGGGDDGDSIATARSSVSSAERSLSSASEATSSARAPPPPAVSKGTSKTISLRHVKESRGRDWDDLGRLESSRLVLTARGARQQQQQHRRRRWRIGVQVSRIGLSLCAPRVPSFALQPRGAAIRAPGSVRGVEGREAPTRGAATRGGGGGGGGVCAVPRQATATGHVATGEAGG